MLNENTSNDLIYERPAASSKIAAGLDVSNLTASLIVNRGYKTLESAKGFLYPKLSSMPDPFSLKDMDRGTELLSESIRTNKKIAIYGDYDVDGLSGAAIVVRFLKEVGVDARVYIPHRLDEGYGLHVHALEKLKEDGIDVLVTVDTGATAMNALKRANEIGLKVIVTDHHYMEQAPPDDFIVINPMRPDCDFPDKHLAGAAVAYLFVVALRQKLRGKNMLPKPEPHLGRLINLAALGVIADVVPLDGFNRVLAKYGLKGLSTAYQPGIRELVRLCGADGDVQETIVSYRIAPRINAAGRMGEVYSALELLLTDDSAKASELASKLSALNTTRQKTEEKLRKEAIKIASDKKQDGATVVWGDKWHVGVMGIVASRLVSEFKQPAIVISLENGIGRGSIRGLEGYDVMKSLIACSDLLESYGGHSQAAGIKINKENLESFAEKFATEFKKQPKPPKKPRAEAEAKLGELNLSFARELTFLGPFGPGNPEPKLYIKRKVLGTQVVGEKHLKIWLDESGGRQDAIAFGMADKRNEIGPEIEILANPRPSYFGGSLNLDLIVKELL